MKEIDTTLMTKKPANLRDIRELVDRPITPAEIVDIVGNKIGMTKYLVCENWEELSNTLLVESQFWIVELKQEGVKLLVDTQGNNFPRYAGLLEK